MTEQANSDKTTKQYTCMSQDRMIEIIADDLQLRANQVGSRVIIKRTDLEQFIESHPIEITPD